ncbi:DUF342 domain-containing protein [Leptospira sp. GIMC2001]|uniref:DUF342 domain-containing protein n=1 Tax=Leptospira sp. GIMC2001 TaxID=1513297 RepID=UPI00234A7BBB|nr:FapA family protein [Leptospira sp. GIMC2001]WCL48265.1 FapA family protein [Leptospira sp. GIMC2001]
MSVTALLSDELKELDRKETEEVEVIGESIEDCLRLAAEYFNRKIHELDYRVIKRGKKKLFFSEPFHIRVTIIPEDDILSELEGLDEKLTGGAGKLTNKDLREIIEPKDKDGFASVKIFRTGVFLTVTPPQGNGKPVKLDDIAKRLSYRGVSQVEQAKVKKIVEESSGKPVLISNQKPRPNMEASMVTDISTDQMRAMVTLIPAKPGGRDLEVQDIVNALKSIGVIYGTKEDLIKKYLDEEKFNIAFPAAEGDPPVNGKNAEVKYHVRTEKAINFREDASGRVDYKDLDLIENVVVGQLLAEKIPAQPGKMGRNLYGMLLPANDGKDLELKQGKGTILSEDRRKLTAEVNGQVLYLSGRLSVETVYRINGDVGIKTGNVTFLGSIVITGNVEDNYHVKAAGNIEIFGTVQKSVVEADGDIVVRQGITGREEARIESTGGNIVAKFIQNATVITDKDIIVQEGIMHSNLMAGGRVICRGKRAQIVGGVIQATRLIAAKIIGSQANPQTELIVGNNPKIQKQIQEYEAKRAENQTKKDQLTKTLKTLQARRESDPASFTTENAEYLKKLEAGSNKLTKRIEEYTEEIQTLTAYMEEQSAHGKVSVEKTLFGGVVLKIKNAEFTVKNEVKAKTFLEENGQIRQLPYEDPEGQKKDWRKKRGRSRVS